jgi:CO/xanthine dehydrogenase Mo-binding subunit
MSDLPRSLRENPRLEQWLEVRHDNRVTLFTGKVELGQGIVTALAQIAAEELSMPLDLVEVVSGHTGRSPDEWYTAASQSIEVSGAAVRLACADAMRLLREAAAARLGSERVRPLWDGRLGDDAGAALGYGELAREIDWSRDVCPTIVPKPVDEYRLVGTPVSRVDLARTITGGGFIHDVDPPGLVHGRVLRPPTLRAELEAFDPATVEACPGVLRVVSDGSFVGVVAEREEQALRAVDVARESARWRVEEAPAAPASARELLAGAPSAVLRAERAGGSAVTEAAGLSLRATFSRPFIAHASIGPSCALALLERRSLTVWSHSQGVFALRDELARTLGLPPAAVTVIHVPGAGSYGHNGADDVALDAALLARALSGRPVRVVWSREDELAWSPVGSAMAVEVVACLGADGDVAAWQLDVWSGTFLDRPAAGGDGIHLLAARHLAEPRSAAAPDDVPAGLGGGGDRNAFALYDFPSQDVRYHFVSELPVRTSSLRALGAFANVFAIESFMDELAAAAGRHPVEYRLRHLADERAKAVVLAAAELAGWPDRWSAASEDGGLGIGFARYKNRAAYCAVVAEIEAAEEVRVRRVWCSVDAGAVINPDGLVNQVEGGIVQATSWTLKEQVRLEGGRIASSSWETYPILRFSEVPEVEVRVLDRMSYPPLGVGEAVHGPTAAAIGNAVADALGVRVRDLPLTREVVVAAMDDAPA